MKGFKPCSQGHFYKETLSSCPYCDSGTDEGTVKTSEQSTEQTAPVTESNTSTDSSNTDGTLVFGTGEKTKEFSGETDVPSSDDTTNSLGDLDRTIISGDTKMDDDDDSTSAPRRKIKGWIVTFDLESFGRDFKIHEGNNNIGRSPVNDITVPDEKVSGKHCVILYRHAEKTFFIKDNMSNNGTFLNGNSLPPDQASELKDGDKIKVGDVVFLFRQAF